MNEEMKKAKDRYDEITIPEGIENMKRSDLRSQPPHYRFKQATRVVGVAVIALFMVTAVGCNTSASFANEVRRWPVVGAVAQIVTFQKYTLQEDEADIAVSIPEVNVKGKNPSLSKMINASILSKCNSYISESKKELKADKQAYLDTGGTEKEWKKYKPQVTVSYQVKTNSNNYLSFIIVGTRSFENFQSTTYYYNLDLKTGQYITLKDLLGTHYVAIANKAIKKQIKEMKKDKDNLFFDGDEGFQTITDKTHFYINAAGKPVVVFDKYAIAPGYMGELRFVID